MNNPPAFPLDTGKLTINQGMTLRDYFAAKAMQGLVAISSDEGGCAHCNNKFIAPLAYDIADEMMEAKLASLYWLMTKQTQC